MWCGINGTNNVFVHKTVGGKQSIVAGVRNIRIYNRCNWETCYHYLLAFNFLHVSVHVWCKNHSLFEEFRCQITLTSVLWVLSPSRILLFPQCLSNRLSQTLLHYSTHAIQCCFAGMDFGRVNPANTKHREGKRCILGSAHLYLGIYPNLSRFRFILSCELLTKAHSGKSLLMFLRMSIVFLPVFASLLMELMLEIVSAVMSHWLQ